MSHISLTIPSDDEKALIAGATMLLTLAGKIPNMELPEMDDGHCESCTSADPCNTGPECVTTSNPAPPPLPVVTEEEAITPPSSVATDNESFDLPVDPTADTDDPNCPELDANGLPWDARIHAGSKAKLQDGTWRKKRGVDDEDYNRIVEELKQLMSAPVRTPELVGDGVSDDTAASQEQQGATIVPPPPPPPMQSPEAAGIVTTEPGPAPDTFPAFLKAVTMKVQAKELTIEQVNSALQPHGVANLQLLGGRPDLIPQIWADLVMPK